jgi:hypothetical protein
VQYAGGYHQPEHVYGQVHFFCMYTCTYMY